MAVPIITRIERGRLYFQIADVLLPSFAEAASVWSAPEAHRPCPRWGQLTHCVDSRCPAPVAKKCYAMNAMNGVSEARAGSLPWMEMIEDVADAVSFIAPEVREGEL